jgi:hypothetical protein
MIVKADYSPACTQLISRSKTNEPAVPRATGAMAAPLPVSLNRAEDTHLPGDRFEDSA